LPEARKARKWTVIAITLVIASLLTIWGIYGIGEYGIALFILIPFFIGFSPATLYAYKRKTSLKAAVEMAYFTLALLMAGLFLFAFEGLICLLMAALPAAFLAWLGAVIGWGITDKSNRASINDFLLLIALVPIVGYTEKDQKPTLLAVTTSIEINTTPEKVWRHVIAFPQLQEPKELLFKAGIAYPINATIKGTGVGAVRYCNFSTGSFVEPITVWDAPKLLKFSVEEQPAPMKEISFWDINAPHLHDYFVSKEGQFRLIPLENGRTRLEGTTWYYHNIKPTFYWSLWSNYIIHKIHGRVLQHIKAEAEKQEMVNLKYKAISDAKQVLGDIGTIRNTFIGFQSFLYSNSRVV
jgi:hypothetical protein